MRSDGSVGILSFPVTRFHRDDRMAQVGLVLFARTALEVMQEVLTVYYCKLYKHTCIRIAGCAPESTRIFSIVKIIYQSLTVLSALRHHTARS